MLFGTKLQRHTVYVEHCFCNTCICTITYFSFSVALYTHLSPSEKISLIQERMKAIQQKYMELKSEVTYLDRKKRKAKKKEREGEAIGVFYV